jgi:osmotically-inducible protein OsmY
MRLLATLLLTCCALLLQGCFPLAATGVGATALMLDDRRSTGIYIEDENVEWKARILLFNKFKDAHVNVTSYNLGVLLTGEAPTDTQKKEIGDAIRAIPSVKNLTNELVVGGNSSLTSRSSDTIITTNVKARTINNGKFSPNHIKVVTEAGVVFLMGIATREEGDAASDIARTTSGVSRVVKVFEYIEKAPNKS